MTKMLVAFGAEDEFESRVEIINCDETKPYLICEDLPNLGFGDVGGTGKLLMRKTPIICGGYSNNQCGCQSFKNGSWMYTGNPGVNWITYFLLQLFQKVRLIYNYLLIFIFLKNLKFWNNCHKHDW